MHCTQLQLYLSPSFKENGIRKFIRTKIITEWDRGTATWQNQNRAAHTRRPPCCTVQHRWRSRQHSNSRTSPFNQTAFMYEWRHETCQVLTALLLGMVGLCGVFLKKEKEKKELNVSQYSRKCSGIIKIKLCQYSLTQRTKMLMFHWKEN